MKKRESMRYKILFLCISSILVALLAQTLLFQRITQKTIYEQTKESNLHSLKNMQTDIHKVIYDIENKLLEIYNQKELIEGLQKHKTINLLKEENFLSAYSLAQTFSLEHKVSAIYIYDGFNRIVSAYRHASTPKYSYPEDVFLDIGQYNVKPLRKFMNQENNVMLVSSYYNENSEQNMIRFAINIFSMDYKRDQIGCVVCDINRDVFLEILDKYAYGENNTIWLQPLGDRVMISNGEMDDTYINVYNKITKSIESGRKEQELDIEIDGGVLFNISDSKYNLKIFSLMSPLLLVKNQQVLTKYLIIFAVILSGFFGFEAIVMARTITSPLENLTDIMRKIRKGEMDLRVEVIAKDEIGELGENFNKMLDEMQHMIAKEYQNQMLLQRAEYKALQAQINPHFLYNTLDTMSSIAQVYDCNLVSNLSESLSAIFRYSLNVKNPMSSIEKEILHLKNYIYVMDVRMNNKIQYIFEIDESLLKFEIPRLTLQPIVENALKYGVRDNRGDKIIKIIIKKQDNLLLMQVLDNGSGMDPKSINMQLLENDINYVEQGDSIGLHNINARIKLLFGDAYGVRIESQYGRGTDVTVQIPI